MSVMFSVIRLVPYQFSRLRKVRLAKAFENNVIDSLQAYICMRSAIRLMLGRPAHSKGPPLRIG
jgi:hypothetical protein